MVKWMGLGMLLALMALPTAASAKGENKETKKALKYEVVDVACYIRQELTGPEHQRCASRCMQEGVMLALLRKGKLYIPVDDRFRMLRGKFVAQAGDIVEVAGTVVAKGGINFLKVAGESKE